MFFITDGKKRDSMSAFIAAGGWTDIKLKKEMFTSSVLTSDQCH